MFTLAPTNCTLCNNPVKQQLKMLDEKEQVFCCAGCQTVYQILKAQGALAQFSEHPIYLQAKRIGLIANPDFNTQQDKEKEIPEEDFHKLQLDIQDLWCPSCAQVIQLILLKEKGVRRCIVDYATDLGIIDYTPRLISKEKILRLIEQLGYRPRSLHDPRQQIISRSLLLRFIVAAFFSLNVMMFAYPLYATYFDGDPEGYAYLFAWLSCLGSLPVLTYSAWPIWRRCYTGLKVRLWGMETLVCLGVSAATGLSLYELWQGNAWVYFDSMTVIIVFVLLGKMIEARAKFSAKDALVQLTRALPRRGRKRLAQGEVQFVPIKEIKVGDMLVVHAGEKIVLDGQIEEGEGACDETLMTGESLPVAKQKGQFVLAGSLLQQGYLVIRVTAILEETALQHIIDMVEQDLTHKSRYVRAADRIVKWFVPLVIGLALGTFFSCLYFQIQDASQTVWQTAWIRAISVLLISCPCAIGIAAPLAESHLLNALAKWGVIVRNRGCLAYLGRETVFIFDKTGTVTEGKFKVAQGLEHLTNEEKSVLKGLVARSTHPIAVALYGTLMELPASFENIEEVASKGMRGNYQGEIYCLGSAAFLREQNISFLIEKDDSDKISTVVYFAKGKNCLTSLILKDSIREGIKEFIQTLKTQKTLLVSGDNPITVQNVAQACHLQSWEAVCSPLQKRGIIDRLKKSGEIVAMVGDGINDAPALTAAQIGIAVLSASEISIQVSDLLLTTSRFQTLTYMRELAVKGQKVIKQNLFWAFFYNCIGLGLAMTGLLSPLFAACAMIVSSLIVLLNAQRLALFAKNTPYI